MTVNQQAGPMTGIPSTGGSPAAPEPGKSCRGADILVEVLRSEGVEYVFGNPGTTELSFVDALTGVDGLSYILGLQEAAVVAMADGYAQASGRPGFVNLHTMAGLGHAMGALLNARQANTPLVVTAGQQDTRHVHTGPLLHGELLDIARPAVKWGHEIRHPDEIAVFARRAFQDSCAAPSGPVFLSLPMDVMERTGTAVPPAASVIHRGAIAAALPELAQALASVAPGRIAILAGDEVFVAGASDEAAQLAEALGATVFGSSWPTHLPFPSSHPLWAGNLPGTASAIRQALAPFDAMLVLGGHFSISILYTEGPAVPSSCRLFQVTSDPHQPGRTHACELACVGGIRESLRALLPLLSDSLEGRRQEIEAVLARAADQRAQRRGEIRARAESEFRRPETTPWAAAHELARALGRGTPLVDESPATMPLIRGMLDTDATRQYYGNRGAILGWGMGAAVGVSLGLGRQPVVAVIGDGSALYAPQALWTAAHERLPVTFVIVNNRSYDILRNFMKSQHHFASVRAGRFIGMDLDEPPIDFLALAASWGLPARRVERAGEIAAAVEHGIASGLPNLIELPVGTA